MIDTGLRPRAFDLIVFDWDGTLYDSTALIVRCIQAACADLGLPVPERAEAAYVIGLGLHDALAHVAPQRRWRVIVRECAIAFGLLLLFMFFGKAFLNLMQLSEVSIRIGGGVILFLIALRLVFHEGDGSPVPHDGGEPFLVPLAVPAIAARTARATLCRHSTR